MTVTRVTVRHWYQCVSTDTKPTTDVPIGSRLFESDTGVIYEFDGTNWRKVSAASIDASTFAQIFVSYEHHERHSGRAFHVSYSVASLGAMTTPDDMITLTFKTPDTTRWPHLVFSCYGSAGWRARFIEGGTGGGASPTDQTTIFNVNRNSLKGAVS